jgi:6-phosphogluconolactonase (cycloisomerase 2 family)
MQLRRQPLSSVLILELLFIMAGCSGTDCPTTSLGTNSGSGSGTGGLGSSSVCGAPASTGTGSGLNGPCTGTASPNNVVYSLDLPLNTGGVANVLPFAIGANGNLTLMCGNASATLGELTVVQNKFLYAFDSTSAKIAAFTIAHANSGALTPVPGQPFTIPDSFNVGIQNFPHIEADPLGRFVFVTNFGGATIDIFKIDPTSGALSVAAGSPVHVNNPIHLAVEPSGNFVYVPDSQGGLVNIFSIDSTGTMTPKTPFIIASGTNDFPLFGLAHPNGKFLFTANRGSVSAFQINSSTGALTYAPGAPYDTQTSLGVGPLQLGLEATGQFVYASNVSNTGIPGYKIDQTTGALTLVPGPLPGQTGGLFDIVANPQGPQMYVHIGNTINVFSVDLSTGVLTAPATLGTFVTASNLVVANVQ